MKCTEGQPAELFEEKLEHPSKVDVSHVASGSPCMKIVSNRKRPYEFPKEDNKFILIP